MPATLIWPLQSIAGGCQSGEMAALFNSLSVAFTNSFLPKYCFKCYDYTINGAMGYNLIGVYRWILTKFELEDTGRRRPILNRGI